MLNPLIKTKINDKLKKGIIVRYQPKKNRRRRYEQKLYENDQYAMQSRENESRFHYLCILDDVCKVIGCFCQQGL